MEGKIILIITCKTTVIADSYDAIQVAGVLYEAIEAIEERGGSNIRITKDAPQTVSSGVVTTDSSSDSRFFNKFNLTWSEEL